MRLLKLISFLILFISPTLTKAQIIQWQPDRPLKWDDFQGKPNDKMNASALTQWSTNYTYNWEIRNGIYVVTFKIENDFDTQGSWVKAVKTDDLLRHEQLHYDINELYTRKLVAALNSAAYTSDVNAEIDKIHKMYWNEGQALQAKYDVETEGSQNIFMQKQWE